MRTRHKVTVALLLGGLVAGLVFAAPLQWTAASAYRSVFPEQNPERPVYDDTSRGPVDLAGFVAKSRLAWPEADVGIVHQAAVDVAVGLLHHSDIEVGSYVGGVLVPWEVSRWKAAGKIRREMMAAAMFLSEQGRYVFRRKGNAQAVPSADPEPGEIKPGKSPDVDSPQPAGSPSALGG